jgi:hypothetical protein
MQGDPVKNAQLLQGIWWSFLTCCEPSLRNWKIEAIAITTMPQAITLKKTVMVPKTLIGYGLTLLPDLI